MPRRRFVLLYMAAAASTSHAVRPERHRDDFEENSVQAPLDPSSDDITNFFEGFEASEMDRRLELLFPAEVASHQITPQSSMATLQAEQRADDELSEENSRTDDVALCTMSNGFSPELQRLLHSIELFNPKAQVYVGTTTAMDAELKKAFPSLKLDSRPIMDKYTGLNRDQMTEKHLWTQMNSEKTEILRAALKAGHAGAWYIDADAYLLAPLPAMGASALFLSPHLTNDYTNKNVGSYNGGCLFVRNTDVLDEWKRVAPSARSKCCQDQTALEALATKFHAANMSCGVNVGWYQMNKRLNPEGVDLYDKFSCKSGSVFFKDCPVVSMHYHATQYDNHFLAEHLKSAMEKCNHPMVEFVSV